jgi:hypothetical protein
MNGGEISGNNTTNGSGGGVYVYDLFIMNGGKISNNATSGSGSDGGGVYVYSYGIFNMRDGEISGNTAVRNGGGVYISGTFLTGGAVIYGNNAAAGLKNTASNGAALYKSGTGTAQYGTITGNTFYVSGNLSTTNTTIRVVNGNLLTE